jgi:hypothetical protein
VPSARLQIDPVSQPARLILPKLTPHLRAYGGSVAPDRSFCAPEMIGERSVEIVHIGGSVRTASDER